MIETAKLMELDRGLVIRGGRSLCFHRYDFDVVEGVWRYRECSRCGRRRADAIYANLAGPVDLRWIETGEWTPPPEDIPKPGGLPRSAA